MAQVAEILALPSRGLRILFRLLEYSYPSSFLSEGLSIQGGHRDAGIHSFSAKTDAHATPSSHISRRFCGRSITGDRSCRFPSPVGPLLLPQAHTCLSLSIPCVLSAEPDARRPTPSCHPAIPVLLLARHRCSRATQPQLHLANSSGKAHEARRHHPTNVVALE